MAKSKNRAPDLCYVQPTTVLLDVALRIDGGTLSHKAIGEISLAVIRAFETQAVAHGLGHSWTCELKCVRPRVMQARIEREGLFIEPPSDRAVAGDD